MFNEGVSLEMDCFYFFTDRLNEDLSTRLAVNDKAYTLMPLSVDDLAPVPTIDDMKQMDQNALVRVLFASQQQQGFFDVVREFDYQEAFVF